MAIAARARCTQETCGAVVLTESPGLTGLLAPVSREWHCRYELFHHIRLLTLHYYFRITHCWPIVNRNLLLLIGNGNGRIRKRLRNKEPIKVPGNRRRMKLRIRKSKGSALLVVRIVDVNNVVHVISITHGNQEVNWNLQDPLIISNYPSFSFNFNLVGPRRTLGPTFRTQPAV
jgi:hypothetical protein